MPKWNPADSIVLLTGASSGIGWHMARRLCAAESLVFATARRQERLNVLQQECANLPGQLVPIAGDIGDAAFRKHLVETASGHSGRIDLLVNNAGIGGIGPFAEASTERARAIMEVNFFAPLELTRDSLPWLRKSKAAVICNISSVLGHRAVGNKSEYCASKFAIHGWSDALRTELAASGIQVTLVSPSTTRSEFFDRVIDTDPKHAGLKQRGMSPDAVAAAAVKAICRRKDEVILSAGGKALVYLDRFCPWMMNRILAKAIQ